jgi:hypothetical protein
VSWQDYAIMHKSKVKGFAQPQYYNCHPAVWAGFCKNGSISLYGGPENPERCHCNAGQGFFDKENRIEDLF